jgi:NTP pyrophosphatase (non-canonical NTP hydrolase)
MNSLDNLIEELWKEMKDKVKERPGKELSILQTLKGMEEFGEIADLVLRDYGAKRKHKEISEEELKKRLGEEIADAMIVLLMLSKNKNIDINKHLKEKIEFEIERWKAE